MTGNVKKSGPGPDWNRIETQQLVIPVVDLGEQFSRLQGGMGSLHRGGHVVFATHWADGIAELLATQLGGTGAAVALDTTKAEFGKQSVKITHGAAIGDTTQINRCAPIPGRSKLGHEMGLLISLTPNAGRIHMEISSVAPDTQLHTYKIRIDYTQSDTKIYYWTLPGSYVLFTTTTPLYFVNLFSQYKLVVDDRVEGAPMYDKLHINGATFDMSALTAVPSLKAAGLPYAMFRLILEAMVASNQSVYLGSWTFSTDEP